MPLREDVLRTQTARDPLLTRVIEYLYNDSWPSRLEEEMLAFSESDWSCHVIVVYCYGVDVL